MTDERRFHYAELVLDTLKHIGAFGDLISQPVDVEVIPNFDGGAERLQAPALGSFVLRHTSTQEIEQGGGRFAYFR